MKLRLSFFLLCLAGSGLAAEINGVVKSATKKYATVATTSKLLPIPGDKARIYFKLPGANTEISVAAGHVYEITAGDIMVEIDNATGAVAKDQLVRINSANPKTAPSTPSPSASTKTAPPPGSTPGPATTAQPHLPDANSEDMHAIGTAVRNYIIGKYVKERLLQAFTFKVEHLLVSDRFANIEAIPVFQDGSKLVPKFLPDIAYNFCLVNTTFGWIVAADLSRSDVPDQTQLAQIRARLPSGFPVSVFSPTWRKLLGGSTP